MNNLFLAIILSNFIFTTLSEQIDLKFDAKCENCKILLKDNQELSSCNQNVQDKWGVNNRLVSNVEKCCQFYNSWDCFDMISRKLCTNEEWTQCKEDFLKFERKHICDDEFPYEDHFLKCNSLSVKAGNIFAPKAPGATPKTTPRTVRSTPRTPPRTTRRTTGKQPISSKTSATTRYPTRGTTKRGGAHELKQSGMFITIMISVCTILFKFIKLN
jgi:hypothetical protein